MQVSTPAPPAVWNTDPVLDPTVGLGELAKAAALAKPSQVDFFETSATSESSATFATAETTETVAAPEGRAVVTSSPPASPEPLTARLLGRAMDAQVAVQEHRLLAMGFQERVIGTTHGPIHLYDRPRAPGVQGPTWVFGHGFASQAASWQAVLKHLAPYCARIICIDFPGHGGSPEVPPGQSAIDTTTVSCLEAMDLLTQEDGAQAVPVGVSMGGLAATVYATERPEQTAAAALISPAGAPMRPESLTHLLTNFAPQTYAQARRTVDLFMPHASFKPVMAMGMLHMLHNPYCRRLLGEFRTFDHFSAERLQRLPHNTLLLWGTEDTVIPTECRDHFFAHTPSPECKHVAGWNHFVAMHESEALAERLLDWGARHNLLARQGPADPTQASVG